jgi:hypothetical protein
LMAAASYIVNCAMAGWTPGIAGLIIQVGLAGMAGIIVYLLAVLLLATGEVRSVWRAVRGSKSGK